MTDSKAAAKARRLAEIQRLEEAAQRQRDQAEARKLKAREAARKERKLAERRAEADQLAGDKPGPAVADLAVKIANGEKVTPTQLANAKAKDDLVAFQERLAADQAEQEARARQERAVQVALDARDQWQILRDEARERATDAIHQTILQLAADLKAAYAPVQTANREMRDASVSLNTIDSVSVISYKPLVDIEDTVERATSAILRRISHPAD